METKEIRIIIGDKLKDFRVRKGEKLEITAKYVEIAQSTLSNYENGKTTPNLDVLRNLLTHYGASINEILIDCFGLDEKEFDVFKKLGLSENFVFSLLYNKICVPEKYQKHSLVNILNIIFENPVNAMDLFESLSLFFNYDLRRSIMETLDGTYYDYSKNPRSHGRYGQIFVYGVAEALELIFQTHFKHKEN